LTRTSASNRRNHLLGGALAVTGVGFVLLFSATTLAAALPAAVLIGMAGSMAIDDFKHHDEYTPAGLAGSAGR
jgi:hypothetical protein